MADVFPIYAQLWRLAESEGIYVHYDGIMAGGQAGYFHARDDGDRPRKPEIAIHRPYYRDHDNPTPDSNAPEGKPQPDLVEELFTLAHEYGHSRSWAGRTPRDQYALYYAAALHRDEFAAAEWKRLDASLPLAELCEKHRQALRAALSDDERRRIVDEEELAWKIGREVLVKLGFADLVRYDETATRHVHNHRYRLGIDDLWPGDLTGAVLD